MEPAQESNLLWGAVGALSFLALVQAYHLLASEFVGFAPMIGVAVVVFGVTAAMAHMLRPRLIR